jgi:hypothetical protein
MLGKENWKQNIEEKECKTTATENQLKFQNQKFS